MSPEQARGKPLDKRTDIWSFGSVLYEMLAGRMAFGGDTFSDTIAKVLERQPEWEVLPVDPPPRVSTLLRRCLEKEPRQRVHDVADVRLAMEGAFDTLVPQPVSGPWKRLSMGLAGLATLLAVTVIVTSRPVDRPTPEVVRLETDRFERGLSADVEMRGSVRFSGEGWPSR